MLMLMLLFWCKCNEFIDYFLLVLLNSWLFVIVSCSLLLMLTCFDTWSLALDLLLEEWVQILPENIVLPSRERRTLLCATFVAMRWKADVLLGWRFTLPLQIIEEVRRCVISVSSKSKGGDERVSFGRVR